MKKFLLTLCILPLFLEASEYQEIKGRDTVSLYRVSVPEGWRRKESEGDLHDTKLPIYTFYADEVKITIHNFPSNTIEDRIPPAAQITRWKGQIQDLEERDVSITPQSFSGYVGYLFEAPGVMGWTMQLGADQYRQLETANARGDVTIKVIGPALLLKRKRETIYKFARSFELIEEIPCAL